jgi:hypothetical protein
MEGELIELNIEWIKKEFKTHRNAINFAEKLINYCFNSDESATKEQGLKLEQSGAQLDLPINK